MSALCWQDIEKTIRTADAQKRHQTLRAVADLFLSNAPNLDEEKVDVFDDVFEIILDDAERAEVIKVSERMAPVANAPRRLIKRLAANPEIAIAGPVLSQSPRLSDEDLCEISRSKGVTHMLAVAGRKKLSAPVTDALIDRGNQEVSRKLVANTSAELSRSGTEQLLKRAETDEVLGAGLCARDDIAPELINTTLEQASARVHERVRRMAAAQRLVLSLKQQGDLGNNEIVGFAKNSEYEELVAALALLSNLRADFVENMTQKGRLGGFVLVCKAVGLTWSSVDAVLALICSRNGIDDNEAQQAHRDFVSVSRGTAERIVRFWCVRQSAQAAGHNE
jgi:uncharacterized protein (DUF2336 family)